MRSIASSRFALLTQDRHFPTMTCMSTVIHVGLLGRAWKPQDDVSAYDTAYILSQTLSTLR
jgi:hypothetical protein